SLPGFATNRPGQVCSQSDNFLATPAGVSPSPRALPGSSQPRVRAVFWPPGWALSRLRRTTTLRGTAVAFYGLRTRGCDLMRINKYPRSCPRPAPRKGKGRIDEPVRNRPTDPAALLRRGGVGRGGAGDPRRGRTRRRHRLAESRAPQRRGRENVPP